MNGRGVRASGQILPTKGETHMKAPAPDTRNIRTIGRFKRIVLLPFTTVAALWVVVCRAALWCRSPAQTRAADQLRQTRARRELRGLPPDHVQVPHKPT